MFFAPQNYGNNQMQPVIMLSGGSNQPASYQSFRLVPVSDDAPPDSKAAVEG